MRRLLALNVVCVVMAACAGGADVPSPDVVTAPVESGTDPPEGAATTTTNPKQVRSGSASTSNPAKHSFVTVGGGAFLGRVVSVEFGDEWAITPADVAVTPGAASGTTVGPAILYFDDGTSLEVPASTPGGNACIELVRPEDWTTITGLKNPNLEQLRRNGILGDCFLYGALRSSGQVEWFDIATEYRHGDPTATLLRRPLRLVDHTLVVEGELGFPLAEDVEIICINPLSVEQYAADLDEHAQRSVIEIDATTGEIVHIFCFAEI